MGSVREDVADLGFSCLSASRGSDLLVPQLVPARASARASALLVPQASGLRHRLQIILTPFLTCLTRFRRLRRSWELGLHVAGS